MTDGSPDEVSGRVGFLSCDETIERLYIYLDGELTDERRAEIAQHLDMCGPCVGAYGFEAELRRVIANRCRDRVPEALIARVASALHDEHDRESPPAGRRTPR
ncbi:MAG: mycothiol system anti-sigma-R factor [Acidimicrobiales bacterium]